MKKSLFLLVLCLLCSIGTYAQKEADKIVGTYLATGDGGKKSKIKIFKYQDGYRAQVFWVENPKNPDGSMKLDTKNPDKAKAKLPISQTVVIDKITYDDGEWSDGKVYDPQTGKRWNVTITFKDAKTLKVRGSFMGIGKSVYWTKLS